MSVTINGTGSIAGLTTPVSIAQGGTNSTATPTAGGVVYGDGSAHQVSAAGTSGQYLKSNGASAPSWATLAVTGTLLNIQYFTTAGTATYTPTSGTTFVIVEVVGGGSGGCSNATGFSGAAGGFARKKITSGFSGVTVTVGAGGAGGTSTSTAGGTSSFGALVSATGGAAISGNIPMGGLGSSGDMNVRGGPGTAGGASGCSVYGGGASQNNAGGNFGGGGGNNNTASAGFAGGSGIVIVYEYA